MAFTGELIYLQDLGSNPVTYTPIPLDKIRYSTYQITPDQRIDIDSAGGVGMLRDLTGTLHRYVVAHKTKVEFELVSMTNTEVEALMSVIRSHWIDWNQRDVYMRYYDPENNDYRWGHFYMPDIPFPIRNIDTVNNVINYNQIRLAFIEY